MNFPCPLLLTSIHFGLQWIFSFTISNTFSESLGGSQVKSMPWEAFLAIALPCGIVTAADVGFSNMALSRISITFYTMVKASSPIFVVISAYIFGIEKITVSLLLVVLIISAGEMLTVLGEVQFDTIGFIYVLIASILSGCRWTVVQLKIQSIDPPLKSTMATMRLLSPVMFISMLIYSLLWENPIAQLGPHSDTIYFTSFSEGMKTLGIGLGGGVLAISMLIFEFYLIMHSSALVLMIGGVLKELVTIMLGVTLLGDEINLINIMGCFVVFSGVILFKVSHHITKIEKSYDSVDEELRTNGSSTDESLQNESMFSYDDEDMVHASIDNAFKVDENEMKQIEGGYTEINTVKERRVT